MIKHLPDVTRPETEIERIIRETEPRSPDDIPQFSPPVQVPGFRNSNDPRIPAAMHPAHTAHTATTVAEWIRDGLTVQHTPPGEARRRLDAGDWCECAASRRETRAINLI